ncbi:MAG TPA: CheR family methyltransferase [Thermoanaerobaculia bacterium]|nr:CheR family methyltransferase [Thermoanaerobaculia bacterium]
MASKKTARVPRNRKNAPNAEPKPPRPEARSAAVFPIVGVGASAGGVQAFMQLVRRLPVDPGLALIFVLHSEKHESSLVEVIERATQIPAQFASNGMPIERDRIYVIPPGAEAAVLDGKLRVEKNRAGLSLPIDLLFTSLAQDQRGRAIGAVLSGSASDGALGTKAIKTEGGITFAQDDTAQFNNMPRAAISAGAVDFVMSPDEIARELVRIARHAYMLEPATGRLDDEQLGEVFGILKASHDVDFTHYKPSTIERRILRRMALHRIESLPDYVKLLREESPELEALYGDLLIRVTGFFRDPEVFEALQREILPSLMHERPDDTAIRVWVPGCATGEEVYSLAISLSEIIHERGWNCPVQIFGTDISDAAIEAARVGIYPETISSDVSPERLRRFFMKADGGYRVSKAIRDCCVFARQNLTKDPPFSRLDLVSCRNVMIYLGSVLQRKVMAIFHYALRPNGYLLLGSSETIGNFADLFSSVDRKHKIYQKKSGLARMAVDFEPVTLPRHREGAALIAEENPANVFREADRVLLSRFSPPGVLVNDAMEILQFRGRTSPYLEPAPGTASFSLLKMAREGLLSELRTAVHTARKKDVPVRREGVRIKNNGNSIIANVEVLPFIAPSRDRHFLILFEDVTEPAQEKPAKKSRRKAEVEVDTRQVARLKRELEATREYLQSIIEEQEAMNEELRSANEEIQSSNEELQSTNEELETAKEELQSSNEELTTLNEELENRATELAEANNDLVNLLASVDIPIVMLDSGLRIRRFNPGAQRALNLIPGDIGRLMSDLKMTLMVDDFEELVVGVIENLELKELEVQDRSGRWFMLRIRPYRTTDNKIEGAVLVLVDIDQLKKKTSAG